MRQIRGRDDELDAIVLLWFRIKRRERCDARNDFNARSTEKLLDSPSREGRFGGDDNLDHGLGSCGMGPRWPSNAAQQQRYFTNAVVVSAQEFETHLTRTRSFQKEAQV